MTRDAFLAAPTYAALTALAAQLKGAALNTALDDAGLGFLRSRTATAKRIALADHYGRRLNSLAIASQR